MRRQGANDRSDRGSPGRFGAIALVLAVVFAIGAAACADGGAESARPRLRRAAPDAAPTVILISMDGTRPADLRPDRLPSLVALGEAGLRAEALVPVNPSNTFPNHVSLATGTRPDVHRLVNNSFVDPVRGRFDRSEPHAWIEAEPIWSVAERHGVTSASFYWVGSEGPWSGWPGADPLEEVLVAHAREDQGRPDPRLARRARSRPPAASDHRLVPRRGSRRPRPRPRVSPGHGRARAAGSADRASRRGPRGARPLRDDDPRLRLGPRHGDRRSPDQPAQRARRRGPVAARARHRGLRERALLEGAGDASAGPAGRRGGARRRPRRVGPGPRRRRIGTSRTSASATWWSAPRSVRRSSHRPA